MSSLVTHEEVYRTRAYDETSDNLDHGFSLEAALDGYSSVMLGLGRWYDIPESDLDTLGSIPDDYSDLSRHVDWLELPIGVRMQMTSELAEFVRLAASQETHNWEHKPTGSNVLLDWCNFMIAHRRAYSYDVYREFGCCFAFSRNGHGTGFFESFNKSGDKLQDLARVAGDSVLELFGQNPLNVTLMEG